MSDQANHDAAISLAINRAMTRTNKTLRGAELSKEQVDVVFNIIRDVTNTLLEEVSGELVKEMVNRQYHEPGVICEEWVKGKGGEST